MPMATAVSAAAMVSDWQRNRNMWVRILEKRTGESVGTWNRRVKKDGPADEPRLRAWLSKQGITGYAQTLLVMERFGYPDFLTASADELIDRQYADRPALRPIFDAIVDASTKLGSVVIQARKTYVSLVSPRRTFARVVATTKDRVDLGLRLERQKPHGRLEPSRIHETMKLQIGLTSRAQVDAEVRRWLRAAYEESL
ncbi:MAG TPA: DUF5655 domain-containing protein [Vicinamibacterales bacterium]|nr:DUF5655 domain-containing protein [Vicinamibacterales bacterium]